MEVILLCTSTTINGFSIFINLNSKAYPSIVGLICSLSIFQLFNVSDFVISKAVLLSIAYSVLAP